MLQIVAESRPPERSSPRGRLEPLRWPEFVVEVCAEFGPGHSKRSKHPRERYSGGIAFSTLHASHVGTVYMCASPQGFLSDVRAHTKCAQGTPDRQSYGLISNHNRMLRGCIL